VALLLFAAPAKKRVKKWGQQVTDGGIGGPSLDHERLVRIAF